MYQCDKCFKTFDEPKKLFTDTPCFHCPHCGEIEYHKINSKPIAQTLAQLAFDAGTKINTEKYYGHPRFYELLDNMKDLHSRKNHDYAGTSDPLKNLRSPQRLGVTPFMGVLIRLQDKWSRLEEFAKSEELLVKGEGVKDTLIDNAIYSLLAIILYEEAEKGE